MTKLPIILIPLLSACKLLEQPVAGSLDAHTVADTILAHAPAIAENAGTLTTMFTGNPALGAAIATLLVGAAGIAKAKQMKKKKQAAADAA
jgi:hypothetical protein